MKVSSSLASLWDMLKLDGGAIINGTIQLSILTDLFTVMLGRAEDSQIDDVTRGAVTDGATRLIGALDAIEAKATLVSTRRLLVHLNGTQDLRYGDLTALLREVLGRLKDEFTDAHLLSLSASEVGLYAPTTPLYGQVVQDKFPSVTYEIAEAAKCLALGRSTASAFHAIRCLEAAIRGLARCLSIPDPTKGADRSWANILRVVKTAMDSRWPTSADRLAGDGYFFEGVYAVLVALQNPYRNATMHLDQIYTEGDARHIFEMVGGVMKKVASRLDENGVPLA